MAYCCVPGYTSNAKKETGEAFHEIPSNQSLREKWLRAISRDGWTPNSTCNYSTVCSKHFLPSDYKEGLKVRRLKNDVIPSVFPSYPAYKQPRATKPRNDSSIRKRACAADKPRVPSKKRKMNFAESSPVLVPNEKTASLPQPTTVKDLHVSCTGEQALEVIQHNEHEVAMETQQRLVFPPHSSSVEADVMKMSEIAVQGFHSDLSDDQEGGSSHSALEMIKHTEHNPQTEAQQRPAFARRSTGIQVDVTKTSNVAFQQRLQHRRKERQLKAKLERLKQTVDAYREELRKLENDASASALREVVEGAKKEEPKAMFLLDQVKNYNKKRPSWTEAILCSRALCSVTCHQKLMSIFGQEWSSCPAGVRSETTLDAAQEKLDSPPMLKKG
ncbi:THAP domain-containing protein 11-like [Ornithodoros turicata]|uniref:THAP domain-containing protein 11-like n=1 Tax=Ornithodoros turicata TaxID=34597 RepID=UPI003139BF81